MENEQLKNSQLNEIIKSLKNEIINLKAKETEIFQNFQRDIMMVTGMRCFWGGFD